MKLKYMLFIFIISFVLLPVNSIAATAINVVCDKNEILSNGNLNCALTGTSSDDISSVHAEIELGENLSLESVSVDSSWEGNGDDGIFDLYTDENKTGTFNIGTFIIKANNLSNSFDSKIAIVESEFSDASFEIISIDDVSINIKIISKNNSLDDNIDNENDDLLDTPSDDKKPDTENNDNIVDTPIPEDEIPDTGINYPLIFVLGIGTVSSITYYILKNKHKLFKI